ncbi:hypothetical protein, partial [Bartonella queenslandensis]|uniref:hypothetical protein n=1 Tax=Bartonella queenslandensis TaxID=481138 RepID=UPI001AEC2B5C
WFLKEYCTVINLDGNFGYIFFIRIMLSSFSYKVFFGGGRLGQEYYLCLELYWLRFQATS